jgi:hypothetical protein
MALGYAGRTGGTSGYAGALLGTLLAEDLEDYDTTGFQQLEPISAAVVALAITRLWQGKRFLPSPSEFREESLEARTRVTGLLRKVHDILKDPIPSLPQIDHKQRSEPLSGPTSGHSGQDDVS